MSGELSSVATDWATLAGEIQRRPRVLIVDDQPANLQALYQVFAGDHQVFMATSGEQALKVCAEKLPDVILLDVVMPGIDGHEVCRRLKRDPSLREIPVIFVTAHDDEAAEEAGLDAGAVDFISKPIKPRIVAARVRTHLMLKRQGDLLRAGAYIDGLTGVANRRAFEERLAQEWRRAARDGTSLAVVMIDIDQFKRYNDHGGHQAGDECLRRVAALLRGRLQRAGDLLCRFGGEEFACLLPGTDADGARAVASSLVDRVAAAALPHPASSVGPCVTISAGSAATVPAPDATAAMLLRRADECLYEAKRLGRARAVGCG